MKLQTGAPHIRAAALTYRRRVHLDLSDSDSEIEEATPSQDRDEQPASPPDDGVSFETDHNNPAASDAEMRARMHNEEPVVQGNTTIDATASSATSDGGANSVAEALQAFYRSNRHQHRATVEEVPEDSETSDEDNGADVAWGLCGSLEPGMGDVGPEMEQEEIDEDGLRAYERLSETFERQLEEIGA